MTVSPGGQQYLIDEIEPLQRARGDQDIVGRASDAGRVGELAGNELAQRPVALRAAVETVGGERLALAPQHAGRCGDQALDRHAVRVIVPADEVVLREAGPLRSGRRQPGTQQTGIVEHFGTHAELLVSAARV